MSDEQAKLRYICGSTRSCSSLLSSLFWFLLLPPFFLSAVLGFCMSKDSLPPEMQMWKDIRDGWGWSGLDDIGGPCLTWGRYSSTRRQFATKDLRAAKNCAIFACRPPGALNTVEVSTFCLQCLWTYSLWALVGLNPTEKCPWFKLETDVPLDDFLPAFLAFSFAS